MKRNAISVFLTVMVLAGLSFPGECQAKRPPESGDLSAADARFVLVCKEKGLKHGLLENAGPDAKVAVGHFFSLQEWASLQEDDGKLSLRPLSVKVAKSRDLAVVVGYWEENSNPRRIFSGQYIVVWKKEGALWKIALYSQIYVENAVSKTASGNPESRVMSPATLKGMPVEDLEKNLFTVMKENGTAKVYQLYAHDELLRLRFKVPAVSGKQPAFVDAVNERGFITGKFGLSEISSDRTLAAFSGSAEAGGPQVKAGGTFVHIWQMEPSGEWKLVLDMVSLAQQSVNKKIL